MKALEEKIKETSLFSGEEKQQILENFDSLDEETKDQLEEAIDDFTSSMISLFEKYKSSVNPKLLKLREKEDLSEDEMKFVQTISESIKTIDESIESNKK